MENRDTIYISTMTPAHTGARQAVMKEAGMSDVKPHELVSSVVKLASLPDVYFEIKRLVDDPGSSLADLGRVVSSDPALTMQLLRIANSAFFGFAAKIETVTRAVNILGYQQVHDLALAASMATAFKGLAPKLMDMRQFWYQSVYCAVVSRIIAARCNVLDSERLFVEGLLCDIGHLVMYEKIPDQAQQALVTSREQGLPVQRAERDLLGFDYAQIGAMLMKEWNLPLSLQESVHYHTEPSRADGYALEACILHIGSQITRAVSAQLSVEDWDLPIDDFAWRTTGLSPSIYADVKREADERARETVELFFPSRLVKS